MRGLTICACLMILVGCGQKDDAGEAAPAPEKAVQEKGPEASPAQKPEPKPEPAPELTEAQKVAEIAKQIPELAGPYMTILEVRTEESALHEKHKDDPKALTAALEAWIPSARERMKPACIAKETMVKPDGASPEANKLAFVMLHLGGATLEFSEKDRAVRDQWDKETKRQVLDALEGSSCLDYADED
jgi:hypothetical protein